MNNVENRSSFYYGHEVTAVNNSLSFSEGGLEIVAEVAVGIYSLSNFCDAFVLALNSNTQNAIDYTYTLDRVTRKITVNGSGNFEILALTGTTFGSTVLNLAGFTTTDFTGSNSYEGNIGSGKQYLPQFLLQKFIDFDFDIQTNRAKIGESAEGILQTVQFGLKSFMTCSMVFITDLDQSQGSPIENNQSAVLETLDFLNYLIKKGDLEFNYDRNIPNNFVKCILESSPASGQGTSFRLSPMYGQGLSKFYEIKGLRFRKQL